MDCDFLCTLLGYSAFQAITLAAAYAFLLKFPEVRNKLSCILFGSGDGPNFYNGVTRERGIVKSTASYETTGSKFLIQILTGSELFSGTDSTIEISIVGEKDQTDFHILDNPYVNDFEAGQLDIFYLDLHKEVGKIEAIILKNSGGGQQSNWFAVEAEVTHHGEKYYFPIYSWIGTNEERTFFPNRSTLPQQVDSVSLQVRQNELDKMKQVYDYALYDDLGVPSAPRPALERYVNRTKAPDFNIPVDELFSQTKKKGFGAHILQGKIPQLTTKATSFFISRPWKKFEDYNQAYTLMGASFEVPEVSKRVRSDVEFGNQRLAGVNPTLLSLLSDRSLFDELKITDDLVKPLLRDGKTINDEVAAKRFFSINVRAVVEPWLERINDGKHNSCAPILILYLNGKDQLLPFAISLMRDGPLYTPLDPELEWYLAKLYYSEIESGVHQLYSHWDRTHACTEPYVVAARRNLSSAHPVFRLMKPHFRYTIAINAIARQRLVCALGHIENAFFSGKYSMEMAADLYYQLWDFKLQALPEDISARGVDKTVLPEYPYRDDGLQLWGVIETMVRDYLNIFYKSDLNVATDIELQNWLNEIKTKGHPHKAHTFYDLKDINSLTNFLTTIIWTVTGHHAAVNFSQYDYTSYLLNYPTNMRKPPPKEKGGITEEFIMETIPNLESSMLSVSVTRTLSAYAAAGEEEFIGTSKEKWVHEPEAIKVLENFKKALADLDKEIEEKNKTRIVPYPYLRPSLVPNSIAI